MNALSLNTQELMKKDVSDIDTNNVLVKDEVFWVCGCGCSLFFVTEDGIKCQSCGCVNINYTKQDNHV